MAAMHLSIAPIAWKDRCARVVSTLISAGSLMFGGEAMAQEPESEPITAVYKAQEVSFQYRSSRQYHSCDELEHRVAVILVAVGARDDINVQASNCDGYLIPEDPSMDPMPGRDPMDARMDPRMDPWDRSRPSAGSSLRPGDGRGQTAHVRVRLMMPVEVTPQILAEIDKDKSRRELVSRVTGNPAAAFNEPIIFAARRQEVTLSSRTIRLQPEDCQLLEQMKQQLFRKLSVRVLGQSSSCGPRDSSRIAPQVTVEALLPTGALLPMPDPEKQKGSGASDDSEAEPTQPKAESPPG